MDNIYIYMILKDFHPKLFSKSRWKKVEKSGKKSPALFAYDYYSQNMRERVGGVCTPLPHPAIQHQWATSGLLALGLDVSTLDELRQDVVPVSSADPAVLAAYRTR